ncbi:hypothetical protein SAMN02787142_3020 [Burkholderia sp. WP9]|nr:hypothetical protein SAMN02787142_3020 [Burkholderia sp. WP9]
MGALYLPAWRLDRLARQDNITLETQVLPYHDDLRLLVAHAKSKNPRNATFELDRPLTDTKHPAQCGLPLGTC